MKQSTSYRIRSGKFAKTYETEELAQSAANEMNRSIDEYGFFPEIEYWGEPMPIPVITLEVGDRVSGVRREMRPIDNTVDGQSISVPTGDWHMVNGTVRAHANGLLYLEVDGKFYMVCSDVVDGICNVLSNCVVYGPAPATASPATAPEAPEALEYHDTAENRIALRSVGLYVQEPFLAWENTGIDRTRRGWFSGHCHETTFPWTGVIYRTRDTGLIGPRQEVLYA